MTQPRPGWRELASRRGVRIAVAAAVIFGALGLLAVVLMLFAPSPRTTIAVTAAESGAAGSVDVTGTGFEHGEVIALTIDRTFVGSTTAKDDGTFAAIVVPPPGAGSPFEVVARGSGSGRSAKGSFLPLGGESPSATPDGSILPPRAAPGIAFYSNKDPRSDETDYEIYVIDPLTKVVRGPLTVNKDRDTSPVWSSDGSRIAWVRGDHGDRDIYVMNADGTGQEPLVDGPTDDFFPAWMRDGSILFVREVGDLRTIWRWREGSAPERVVDLPNSLLMMPSGWSIDGTQLAMWGVGPQSADNDLYILHLDGTLDRMTTGTFDDRSPAWAPGGRTIAFVRSGGEGPKDSDLYLLEVKSKSVTTHLTDTDFNDGAPAWGPNGRQLAFCRKTPEGFEIYTINVDRTNETPLMTGRGGLNLDPNWR